MNTIYFLTNEENIQGKEIGLARYRQNRKRKIKDRQIGPQDPAFTDINGVKGEIAFGRLNNLPIDLSVSPRHGGYDFLGHNGERINVKTTKYRGGKLVVPLYTDGCGVDIYALMIGSGREFRYIGWIPKEELISETTITDLGHGDTYALEQQYLRAPKNFGPPKDEQATIWQLGFAEMPE